jgi:hypothetical protein
LPEQCAEGVICTDLNLILERPNVDVLADHLQPLGAV